MNSNSIDLQKGLIPRLGVELILIEGRIRFNDGVVDHEGRYWASTVNDPKVQPGFKDEGVLFRLDPDLTLHQMIEKVTIPNGMGFTVDGKTMYFTDTPISDREAFYHPEGDGGPDGLAMDSTGCLWIAVCGGGKVLKVSPEAKLLGEISLAYKNDIVSCVCWGGPVHHLCCRGGA